MLVINLYTRLVKNENARTEALVDLLERILKKDQEEKTTRFRYFISEVLLNEPTSEEEKVGFLETLKNMPLNALSINAQYRTLIGVIPDIVVFNGDRPICAIEVKIDASLGEEQLESYDAFLQQTANGNPTALVLLTQSTQPPEGFTNPDSRAYRTSLRSLASWGKVAKWFEELSQESAIDEPLNTLAREFGEFLKEDAMPTLDDAARARLYLTHSHNALVGAVQNMAAGAGEQLPDGWSAGNNNRIRQGRIGISGWLAPRDNDSSIRWVQYGLCFNPVDESDEYLCSYQRYENENGIALPEPIKIEDGFYAFVCVRGRSDECQKIPGYSNNQWYEQNLVQTQNGPNANSKGWYYYCGARVPEGGYAKICPIQELLDSDGHLRDRLQEWTHGRLAEAIHLWNTLF